MQGPEAPAELGNEPWTVRLALGRAEDLGKVVDRLRIMTYDYSWRGSDPGPIAPLHWVQSVAEYARTVVDPAKIQIGISFYAYDWGQTGLAYSWTWTEVQEIINDHQPEVTLVEQDAFGLVQESKFYYGDRTVWFSNYRSLEAKLDMVRDMDLAGIAIWRLGNEDPKNWSIIRTSLQQDPVIIQRTINRYIPDR
nr:Glycosyl hydrolases family 18 [uncultured bacterium]